MANFQTGSLQDREFRKFRESPSEGPLTPSVGVVIENSDPIPVTGSITVTSDSIMSGTVDGTASGPERTIVNNRKNQVLASHDLTVTYSWLDFGTKNERVSSMIYASPTFPGVIVTRTFTYTQLGPNYRLDSEAWVTTPGG